jgi:hypothetical protein
MYSMLVMGYPFFCQRQIAQTIDDYIGAQEANTVYIAKVKLTDLGA